MSRPPWLPMCALAIACGGGASDPEIARLRAEVDSLRRDVDALSAADRQRQAAGESTVEPRATTKRAGQVTLRIAVSPADAVVYIDGKITTDRVVKRRASNDTARIRIEKTGFRVVEQSVSLDRSHELNYTLMRGRGMVHKPAAR